MRKKTVERREVLLNAAADVFCDVGYERASMDAIAMRAGLSKATVYGYFRSKDDLFSSAMFSRSSIMYEDILKFLCIDERGIENVLINFGKSYTNAVSSDISLSFIRTTVGLSKRHSLMTGKMYEEGSRKFWLNVANYFDEAISVGLVRNVDSNILSIHLKGLLEAGVIEPLIFSKDVWFDIDASVSNAVDAFLRAYKPVESDSKLLRRNS